MSGSKQRFRRISLTLGRKKKKSVDDRYMELQRDTVADQNGKEHGKLVNSLLSLVLCTCTALISRLFVTPLVH